MICTRSCLACPIHSGAVPLLPTAHVMPLLLIRNGPATGAAQPRLSLPFAASARSPLDLCMTSTPTYLHVHATKCIERALVACMLLCGHRAPVGRSIGCAPFGCIHTHAPGSTPSDHFIAHRGHPHLPTTLFQAPVCACPRRALPIAHSTPQLPVARPPCLSCTSCMCRRLPSPRLLNSSATQRRMPTPVVAHCAWQLA